MTPQQVESAARRRYNSEDSTFWSQDEVFKVIYEGELILAREALVIEASTTSTSTDGTRAYSFPSGFIAVKRIEYNGSKLRPIDFREDDLLTLSNSTTTEEGTPQYYVVWNDQVYLRPIPDTSDVTITWYGYKEPTLLTTVSSTLSIPSRFHVDLIEYTASIMAAKDENLRMAQYYEARWMDRVERAKAWQKKRLRTDSFATVKSEEALSQTLLGTV
jgi:hypothetical protein